MRPPNAFRALIPAVASLLFLYLLIKSLYLGVSPSIGRASAVLGKRHEALAEPSQFWFMIMLYAAGAIGLGYLAWREYNK